MYLLLFEAWARLLGFNLSENVLKWGNIPLFFENSSTNLYRYEFLLTSTYTMTSAATSNVNEEMYMAVQLANLMTHASLILIFIFIVMSIVFLFRLVSGMLSGRR